MFARLKNKQGDILAGVGVTLRVVRDSADVFPPLKSVAAAGVNVLEMSERVKSNKKECRRLARRSADIVDDILRQTRDYGEDIPLEAQYSIAQIEQIFHKINGFMTQLSNQRFMKRYARQLENKDQIVKYEKLLDETLVMFRVSLQISIHRRLTMLQRETSERHDKVLDVSRISDLEREQLLTKILAKTAPPNSGISPGPFFFLHLRSPSYTMILYVPISTT